MTREKNIKAKLSREAILPRLEGIQKNLERLENLAKLPFDEFSKGDAYDLAQHHLRLALEGIFNIASHVLSRLPGERAVEYKGLARNMGKQGIVPVDFSEKTLVPMAGMRNMLVHTYSDLDPKRLYQVISEHRKDIDLFLKHMKGFLKNLEKFGLAMD